MNDPLTRLVARGEVTLDVTPETLAAAFCAFDTEQMAEFFDRVAGEAETWRERPGSLGDSYMWWEVRKRLSVRAHAILLSMSELLWEDPR